tara:strand:- start:354 stop:509 length:156 start_codon:yes stop_codon:yes gene_type:complete
MKKISSISIIFNYMKFFHQKTVIILKHILKNIKLGINVINVCIFDNIRLFH